MTSFPASSPRPRPEATLCVPPDPRPAVLIAVISLIGGCSAASPVLQRPSSFHRGVALGLFDTDAHLGEDLLRLDEIRALGATDVSLVITWTQADVHASRVEPRAGHTASRASVV